GADGHAVGRTPVHDHRSGRLQADVHSSALTLSPAARDVLQAVAATLVVEGPPDLGERVARKVASLPRAADRPELDLLLRLLDSRAVNLLFSGLALPFTQMSADQRERCLRDWATSRLPQRRKAFQALKRLTTVTHYTTPGVARGIGYPGPLGPPPATAKPIRPVVIERDTTLTSDVFIVGSGAGGGLFAAELAAAGKDVVVLERGGYRHEAEFTRSLDAVARRIGVNTDHAKPSARDQVLIRGLEQLGWHHGLLPRDVRNCPQDDACGYCGMGCRRGAKQSTLITYLQDAAQRGARMVVNCDVRRVLIERSAAIGVEARIGNFAVTVRANAVVVAAGSVHSPALLLRSGVTPPALRRNPPLHPATAVLADMEQDVRPWTGTVQAHYSDQFADLDAGYGFKFETAPVHPSLQALAAPWESGAGHRDRMARLPKTALVGILLRDRFG